MSRGQVLQVVLRLDPGGTERLVIEIVRRLAPRFPMAVCCLDAAGAWAEEVRAIGVDVHVLHRRPGFQPGLAWQLATMARQLRTRIFHCHHYSPFVYGRIASTLVPGSHVVFTEHGRLAGASASGKRRWANRLLMPGVSGLFAVSHDLRRYLLEEAVPERMAVIWNGIDPGTPPSPDDRRRARAALRVEDHHVVVGTVARLDAVKDLSTLVRAVALASRAVPDMRLVIVGDGPVRQDIERAAAEAAVSGVVHFAGHRDDARRLMPAFDLYANSSASEGISLTILEAMAAQLPVVATAVGGTPEVVADGDTGVLVPAGAPEAMAAALTMLGGNPGKRAAFGAAARRRVVDLFALNRMVDDYAGVYARLVGADRAS